MTGLLRLVDFTALHASIYRHHCVTRVDWTVSFSNLMSVSLSSVLSLICTLFLLLLLHNARSRSLEVGGRDSNVGPGRAQPSTQPIELSEDIVKVRGRSSHSRNGGERMLESQ